MCPLRGIVARHELVRQVVNFCRFGYDQFCGPHIGLQGNISIRVLHVPYLAQAHAGLGQFADARCCIGEAMKAEESVEDRLWEADILRTAGEIALNSPTQTS